MAQPNLTAMLTQIYDECLCWEPVDFEHEKSATRATSLLLSYYDRTRNPYFSEKLKEIRRSIKAQENKWVFKYDWEAALFEFAVVKEELAEERAQIIYEHIVAYCQTLRNTSTPQSLSADTIIDLKYAILHTRTDTIHHTMVVEIILTACRLMDSGSGMTQTLGAIVVQAISQTYNRRNMQLYPKFAGNERDPKLLAWYKYNNYEILSHIQASFKARTRVITALKTCRSQDRLLYFIIEKGSSSLRDAVRQVGGYPGAALLQEKSLSDATATIRLRITKRFRRVYARRFTNLFPTLWLLRDAGKQLQELIREIAEDNLLEQETRKLAEVEKYLEGVSLDEPEVDDHDDDGLDQEFVEDGSDQDGADQEFEEESDQDGEDQDFLGEDGDAEEESEDPSEDVDDDSEEKIADDRFLCL